MLPPMETEGVRGMKNDFNPPFSESESILDIPIFFKFGRNFPFSKFWGGK
ncbi:MAG: hypothetical protein CM15mP92_0120 [Halieaceae bacterium]|nr:MAG: hypothetical protein CM15mP92_0120 [Halieaceae bacterium]